MTGDERPPDDGWDGLERRNTPPVIEEVGKRVTEALNHQSAPPAGDLNLAQQLVITAVLVVLLALSIFNQFRIMSNLNHHRDATRSFNRSMVCLLVAPDGETQSAALARCGLVDIPGARVP